MGNLDLLPTVPRNSSCNINSNIISYLGDSHLHSCFEIADRTASRRDKARVTSLFRAIEGSCAWNETHSVHSSATAGVSNEDW